MASSDGKISIRVIWQDYKGEILFFLILSACVALGHWASRFIPVALLYNAVLPLQHGANVAICILGATLLFSHSDGLRIRTASAWALIAWGVADSAVLIQDYLLQMPILRIGSDAVNAYTLLIANFLGWILLVYPTEALRPGWLNWKRGIFQLLPMVVLVVLDYFVPYDLRWLIALYPLALLFFVMSNIHAYRLQCEENYSSMEQIDTQWIVRYLSMVLLIGVSYVYICLSTNPGRVVTQNALLFFVFCYSIEQILFRKDPWQNMQSTETESGSEHAPDAAARGMKIPKKVVMRSA